MKQSTFGQKCADKVASFGGSWTFIFAFSIFLAIWMGINCFLKKAFDPYPFILLNLALSALASLQAPIIMMSQNRQAEIDRENAAADYEINIQAEKEIRDLHETTIKEIQKLHEKLDKLQNK